MCLDRCRDAAPVAGRVRVRAEVKVTLKTNLPLLYQPPTRIGDPDKQTHSHAHTEGEGERRQNPDTRNPYDHAPIHPYITIHRTYLPRT